MKNRNLNHSDHWKTPPEFYNKLDAEFHFNFDPCPLYAEFDGLNIEWQSSNYVNPPYSRKLKEAFKDLDVYLYLKSEDTQWYRGVDHGTNAGK